MKSLSSFSLSVLSAAILAGNAFAAEEPAQLAPVVVSATRTPETAGIDASNIQIITRKDIERSGAQNVTDLLRQVAAIQLIDTFGDGTTPGLAMRGFGENGSQNSLLLLNGRRLNNDSDIAAPDLRNLSLEDVDHIEVINGSAGALFGSGAIGGVVNIITKNIKPEVKVGASRGSFDLDDYRLRAGAVVDGVGAQVIGERNLADNYRRNDSINRDYLQARLSYDTELLGLYADASHQNLRQGLPGSLFQTKVDQDRRQAANPTDYNDAANERYNQGVRVSFAKDWNFVLDATQRFDASHGQISVSGTPYQLRQTRNQQSFYPKLNGSFDLGGSNLLKLVLGYDRTAADYHLHSSLSGGSDQSDNQITGGSYTQANLSLGKDWEFVVGGRHATYAANIQDSFTYTNGVRITDSKDIGSIATYWRPVNGLSTWLRADQNFRFAMVDEQTNIVYGTSTPLHTQDGVSYEAGSEYRDQDLRASLQLFQLDLRNEISYDPTQFANVNLPDTRRRGLNANVNYKLDPAVFVGGQFAYVNAKFDAGPNDGKRVPLVARDNTTLNLTWLFMQNASVVLEQQRLGSRFPGGDYSNSLTKLKPLYLTNLAARYTWEGLETSLRVNNVFNKQYNAYATSAFTPSFTVDTAYMPAAGATYLLSVDYKLL